MLQDDHGALTLYFEDRVRVTGEALQGRVDLNMAMAQEQNIQKVHVKLRGGIRT
jgi:hypothetical protein